MQFIDGDPAGLARLATFYAEHGVTGFLATVGGSLEHIFAGIRAVRTHLEETPPFGARCLGIHLEGPFLSPEAPGAFRSESIIPPDLGIFEALVDAAGGHLRLITIAPEVPGATALVEAAVRHGVVCSAGHSVATGEQMAAAVEAGVRGVTHVFNAMSPFHHRRPGIVGAALTDPRLTTEVIADGLHVHPDAVRLLVASKGAGGIALVTDSIAAAGLADGHYDFEEQEIRVADGAARLADGTLAGSTLTMDVAVTNFALWTGLSWELAVRCATEVPARLLGRSSRSGAIAVGMDADLAGFTRDHLPLWTMVAGRLHSA